MGRFLSNAVFDNKKPASGGTQVFCLFWILKDSIAILITTNLTAAKTGKRSLCANVRLVQRLLFLLDRCLKHHRKNAYIYIDPKIANVQQFFSNFFEKIFAWENTQLILGIE